MDKKEILELLEGSINRCYLQLKSARSQKGFREDWIEGFRSRLDELLLLWHQIHNISFVKSCEFFKIDYKEVCTEKE